MTFKPPSHVYILKQGNKTLSIKYHDRHYMIAFKNVAMARNIHYTIHPEPQLTLLRKPDHDNLAMLFINKHTQGSPLDPMNDVGFHLNQLSYKEFLEIPSKNNLGIILSYNIADDSLDEMAFDTVIIDTN